MCCSQESMTIAISVHMIQQDPNCSYSLVHPIPSYKGRSKEDNKTTVNQNRDKHWILKKKHDMEDSGMHETIFQKVWRVDGRESDNVFPGGGDDGGRGGVAVVVLMKSISGMENQKMARDRRRCGMVRRPVTWNRWIWDYSNDHHYSI
ncbi:unnamed protein product [Brassica rapa]|uniref:Uncharacterized protein n=1 Tax=Brassica campestris TaxID=3711 RepID=A0A8D9CPM6_BRACM|nr:unnamed protein product [Brassica rapa]CAG7860899.1 unnamed protein product [Brassica rapa]